MTGEGTGLEALASPQAGYLGKVQERAASLECCPWCTSKGLIHALRSYRINLQESITLCTNPQCLFPLVTRPLEDVLASLNAVEPTIGNKRQRDLSLEEEEVNQSPLKHQRFGEKRDPLPQSGSFVSVGSQEHCSLNPETNGHNGNLNTDCKKVFEHDKESSDIEPAEWDHKDLRNEEDPVLAAQSGPTGHSLEALLTSNGAEMRALSPHFVYPYVSEQNNVPASNGCSGLDSSHPISSTNIKSPSTLCCKPTSTKKDLLLPDIPPCQEVNGFHSECQGLSDKLVSVPKFLLWRNSDNLCWLDSMLAVLVNCKSLKKLRPKDEPQRSSVWRLLREHEDICAAVQAHQQTGRDGVLRVPSHVLQNAHVDLQSLRMSAFKLLQPKLHCKLGQKETPVFAFPLLLTSDSWVERLFQTTFCWEFKCSDCKVMTKERVVKTLPTFTNLVPDWTPLNAVHFTSCNVCSKKNQRRKMSLESLPPVFALHFVEGLPDNNIGNYTFSFKGKCYSVKAVIQYKHQLEHFVSWIYNEAGSWLEYDDLKHPACETYQQLQIPAQEIHVVFWEVKEDTKLSVCSPTNTVPESAPPENVGVPSLKDLSTEEQSAQTPDQSSLTSPNDTDIICALSEDTSADVVDADANATIGGSTLFETFEGLTHNDIITLTLVEFQPDSVQSETQPLKDVQQTENPSSLVKTEEVVSLPDSSIPPAGQDLCHTSDSEPAPPISPSDSEAGDSSQSDPTFVPGPKRQLGKRASQRKTASRKRGKKAASSKDAPKSKPPTPSEPPQPVCSAPKNTAPIIKQTSMVSSTNSLPPPITQGAPWSFLLSRLPQHQFNQTISNLSPIQNNARVTEVKPSHPVYSTPNPVQKPLSPSRVPKAPLITEEGQSLPPKPAEMYGGFGAKSSTPFIPPPSPLSIPPAAPPNHHTSLTLASPSVLREISSLKKPVSSKVPPVISNTEALRYKLLKKLKAKKKKLAKLNQLLGDRGGGTHLRPDSTDLNSPSTVSSSTYNGSTCDDILSDLLSPATTDSHLSPDSTGFFEMLASGQDGANQVDHVVNGAGNRSQTHTSQHEDHNFLEEFLSQL